jgi:4-hydroxy-2-oxoheptanedioate aldolase
MPTTGAWATSLSVSAEEALSMQLPSNTFKQALRAGRPQIGLWMGLANPYTSELIAPTGFDWFAIDAEHSPNDPRTVLAQLQAIAPYPVHGVVRTVSDDATVLKQYLDIGAQTVLVPMVETAEQAARIVAATRYPPRGIRGVGSALARASRWNQVENYLQRCEEEICVLVQIESLKGMENLASICAVEGVDGVFFGPADLSASMGLLGRSTDPEVQAALDDGIRLVTASGKAAGVLTTDRVLAQKHLDLGTLFVAVGVDTSILVRAAQGLIAAFK